MTNPILHPEKILASFETQRVMVVGDVMLDTYISGATNRISPEAPVPILEFEQEEKRLGGAANVALNLAALGAVPILCGLVGRDADGHDFFEKLVDEQLMNSGVLSSTERMTTVKSRIMAGNQQLLRLDKESRHDLTETETRNFLEYTILLMDSERITGLIFQDYNKGVLTPRVIKTLVFEAKKRNLQICVDPKRLNFWNYVGVDLFKPNLKEVRDALQANILPNSGSLESASSKIREKIGAQIMLITLSEQGIFLDDGGAPQIYPTRPRTVADVCGAGDTVISIAALALGAGLTGKEIAILANLAGGQVVEKIGVVSVNKEQLKEEMIQLLLQA